VPNDVLLLVQVFVDDYVKAVAGPPNRTTRHAEELWLARAVLHAIHSLFPSPGITNHVNGRDSISIKKLLALDGLFDILKTILGFLLDGRCGCHRTVGIPPEKADSYVNAIREALDNPCHYISYSSFQKLHGKLVHTSAAMPSMRGFMTVFNRTLAAPATTVGLGRQSALRPTLNDFLILLRLANIAPSHITELVGADLPHVYGYTDASRSGMGGVILSSTRWIHPTVWRIDFPADILAIFDRRAISINDLEMAANFVAERLAEHLFHGAVEGLNTWFGSDNTTTISWKRKQSARSSAGLTFAPQILRAEAILQRYTRCGPQDVDHITGLANLMGDFPSRSYDQGFPAGEDGNAAFLLAFSHKHPLPTQLGRWQFVPPPTGITSVVFSMLRGPHVLAALSTMGTGEIGLTLPSALASTLCCQTPRAPTTIWNEQCCSWPLLLPCGEVDTTMAERLKERKSRGRFANARSSWSRKDCATLGEWLRAPTTSTLL
jgi:hypothetical protein